MTRNVFLLAFFLAINAVGGCGNGGSTPAAQTPPLVLSANANLSTLTITGTDLEQAFDPSQSSYSALVGFLVASVHVDVSAEDGAATMMINGVDVGSSGVTIALVEGNNDITVEVTAENRTTTRIYILTLTRQSASVFAQDAYIKSSNTDAADLFGGAVALSGNTLAVGAFSEDSAAIGVNGDQTDNGINAAGAVYVFIRDATGVWAQQAYIKASNTDFSESFGKSIALSGDTLAVGAPREDSAATGINGDQGNNNANSSGAVYVFARNSGGTWSQQAYIKASNTEILDEFGSSIALSGDTLAVGAGRENSAAMGVGGDQGDNSRENSGAVYIFTRDGFDVWSQQAYVKASNTNANDFFGFSVALSGNTLAVGAVLEGSTATGINGDQNDNNGYRSGAVYVYSRDGAGVWVQQAYIKASNSEVDDRFGWSVTLSGDTLAVGAPRENSAAMGVNGDQGDNSRADSGAVYVFTRDDAEAWSQEAYIKASNTGSRDTFGESVALSGDSLAIGARGENSAATGINGDQDEYYGDRSGAVYVFMRDGVGMWAQQAYIKASNNDDRDNFGASVALADDKLAVGARLEDSAATGVDGDQGDNNASSSGAVYVFGGMPTRNANLSFLDLGDIDLDQIFQRSITDYTADVGFLIGSAHINAPSEEPGAIVRVNGVRIGAAGIDVLLAEGSNTIQIEVTAEDGVTIVQYTVTVRREAGATFAQSAYVKASNTNAGDFFGHAVALSGDTLAVGARFENSTATGVDGNQADNSRENSGAVYVFTRDGAKIWSQQAYIKASNTDADDYFGWSVALSGNTLAVGASMEDSATTDINGNQADNSMPDAGAVYIFARDLAGIWTQQAYIKASNADAGDRFGESIALAVDTLAVGVRSEDSGASGINNNLGNNDRIDSGAAYIFTRDLTGNWSQEAYIKASNPDVLDLFGWSISLSGETLAVGAFREDSASTGINGEQGDNNAHESGSVYVFTRDPDRVWSQQAYIKASNSEVDDFFGWSVAISGDTLAVGARFENSAAMGVNGDQGDNSRENSGAVYVFTRDGVGAWSQEAYIKASNTDANDRFGESVALSGTTLAVGAQFEDSATMGIGGIQSDNNAFVSGAVYLFMRDAAGVWSQRTYVKASNTDVEDRFGRSVALSGDLLAVGANAEESAATGIGGDQSNNNANQSGAVYVLE